MAFRKLRAKKYAGLSEYYNANDTDKTTKAYYLSYRNEFAKSVKIKLKAIDKDNALTEANKIKEKVRVKINAFGTDKKKLDMALRNMSLTLDAMADLFFSSRTAKNNKLDKRSYEIRIRPSFGNTKIGKIRTKDIEELQSKLSETYAPKTVNETISLLSIMFNAGIRNQWVDANPISRDSNSPYYIPKLEVSTETGRSLNDEELDLLFITLRDGNFELSLVPNPRLYLFCKLLYYTGARPDAIISLRVSDYNQIKHTTTIKAMKLSSNYIQPLKAEAEELLALWIKEHNLGYDDCIFYPIQTFNRTNDPIIKLKNTRYETLRRTGHAIFNKLFNVGLPTHALKRRAGFYSLRRTAATKIYRVKGLAHASKFLHHSDVRTTMRYLGIDDELEGSIDVL